MLPEVYYTAGAVFAVFEVLHKGIVVPLLVGSAKKVSFTLGSSIYHIAYLCLGLPTSTL